MTTGLIDQLSEYVPAAARLPLSGCLVAFVGWGVLFLATTIVTRPLPVRPGPATQDLPGDEPPAVVSLLVNSWSVTEDAAESTLLDLAARGYFELRQPDADPRHSTIHVVADDARAAAAVAARQARVLRVFGRELPLTDYERQVLDHIKGATVGGIVPLTALTFRDEGVAANWAASFAASVVSDARRRGLVERRVPRWMTVLLAGTAVLPSLTLSWFTWAAGGGTDAGALFVAVFPFALLVGLARRDRGLRGTPTGRDVAARWLGVRRYLQVDESFAELPPSAVAVWDRYLAYGDALGVTHVSSAAIDLGMGNRARVWSAFGGSWHQVRVTYPGRASRYGAVTARLVVGGLLQIAIGYGLLRLDGVVAGSPDPTLRLLLSGSLALGVVLGIRGIYRIVRAVIDVAGPRTMTAEVLWVTPWRVTTTENSSVVTLHYLAVDDGSADRTTAWALPAALPQPFGPGETVELTVRPWTRRVLGVHPVPIPLAQPIPTPPAPATLTVPATAASGTELLSAAELSSWFGVPLLAGQELPVGPSTSAWSYRRGPASPGIASDVVVVSAGRGAADAMTLARARRGTPVRGLGEEAYLIDQGAVARWGTVVVQVSVPPQLGVGRDAVLAALQTAVLRVAKERRG